MVGVRELRRKTHQPFRLAPAGKGTPPRFSWYWQELSEPRRKGLAAIEATGRILQRVPKPKMKIPAKELDRNHALCRMCHSLTHCCSLDS